MSAVTLAGFDGLDARMWDFPATPQPVVCRSSYPRPQSPAGFLVCSVDHAELGTDVHGAPVGPVWFPWATEAAAAAWALVHRCTRECCGQVVAAGESYCSTWCRLQDKNPAERDDAESEAAA